MYANASFLSERLLAQTDNEEVRLLLAESYLGEGKPYKAYEVLVSQATQPGGAPGAATGSLSPETRYKLALICIKLERYGEAERILLD